jgi:hypothetical protein
LFEIKLFILRKINIFTVCGGDDVVAQLRDVVAQFWGCGGLVV